MRDISGIFGIKHAWDTLNLKDLMRNIKTKCIPTLPVKVTFDALPDVATTGVHSYFVQNFEGYKNMYSDPLGDANWSCWPVEKSAFKKQSQHEL
jgi:hypothetical protein